MKSRLLHLFPSFALIICLFLQYSLFAQPGSNDPLFNPGDLGNGNGNYPGNRVNTTLELPDGKIMVGGSFSSFNSSVSIGITRTNPDGSLDTSFHAGVGITIGTSILALARQSDGKIIVGGSFITFNGIPAARIIRLHTDGRLDTSFRCNVNNAVNAIAIQSNGFILLAGDFNQCNGLGAPRIARVKTNGNTDENFNPGTGPQGTVFNLLVENNGSILIAGNFLNYDGNPRKAIARISASGALDGNFAPTFGISSSQIVSDARGLILQPNGRIITSVYINNTFPTPDAVRLYRLNSNGSTDATFSISTTVINGEVSSLDLQSDGKIVIGGSFSAYNGISKKDILRLNANGIVDNSFLQPNFSTSSSNISNVNCLSSGKILMGGSFTINNSYVRNIASLSSTGVVDPNFNRQSGSNAVVRSLFIQPDRKILVGGDFTWMNANPRNYFSRLLPDGSVESSFNAGGSGPNNIVSDIFQQPDGKTILLGNFSNYNGINRSGIVRVLSNGAIDPTFNPGSGFSGFPYTGILQPDGKIVVAGDFTFFNGNPRSRVVRINANGIIDANFIIGTGANNSVLATAIQSDGKIIIGGSFTTYNGVQKSRIARLNTNGNLDTDFATSFSGVINNTVISAISVNPDGKVLVCGSFNLCNGVIRNGIARLKSDGTLDLGFDPGIGPNGSITSIAVQTDGKILLGGNFSRWSGIALSGIVRLDSNGNLDGQFATGKGTNGAVLSIALSAANQPLIGGSFTAYQDIGRNRIARLLNCIPAVATVSAVSSICAGQNLSLTGGPSAISYKWSGPNSYSSSVQSPTIANITTAGSGLYSLRITNDSGCVGTASVQIFVKPRPIATATSNTPVCQGDSLRFTGGAPGLLSYAWTGPNGFISSNKNPTIPNFSGTGAGTYSLVVTNDSGCTNTITTNVILSPQPVAVATLVNVVICLGTNLSLMGSPGSLASYSWVGPNGFTSAIRNPSIPFVTSAAAGSYILTVSTVAGCKGKDTLQVTVNDNPLANASASANVCAGNTLTLTGGPETMTSYKWSGPAGFSSLIQNPVIANVSSANNGSYILIVKNSAGCADTAMATVAVTTINTNVTVGANGASATQPNSIYQWINCLDPGQVGGAIGQTFSPSTNGSFAVIITNNGCTDTSACVTITSINELLATGLNIYPNPGNGNLTVESETEPIQSIGVYNLQGALVKKITDLQGKRFSLQLNQSAGVFFIEISRNGKTFRSRVVVQ